MKKKRSRLFLHRTALALGCLFLPYALAAATGKAGSGTAVQTQEGIFVQSFSEAGIERVPGEDYLIGAMAASVRPQMEPELLKAQAVVLRTNLYEAYLRAGDPSRRSVPESEIGQDFLTPRQMRLLWGAQFSEYYDRCAMAVEQTGGTVLTYEGIPVQVPFFYVSAGVTRDGAEAFAAGDRPYLRSVSCPQDCLCPEYASRYTYGEAAFLERLREHFPGFTGDLDDLVIEREESGYVRQITERVSQDRCTGEAFRAWFQLPSSCFSWSREDGTVTLSIRGIGHGAGMSQYAGNVLAQQGKTCSEILHTFFPDMILQEKEKME